MSQGVFHAWGLLLPSGPKAFKQEQRQVIKPLKELDSFGLWNEIRRTILWNIKHHKTLWNNHEEISCTKSWRSFNRRIPFSGPLSLSPRSPSSSRLAKRRSVLTGLNGSGCLQVSCKNVYRCMTYLYSFYNFIWFYMFLYAEYALYIYNIFWFIIYYIHITHYTHVLIICYLIDIIIHV